MSVFGGLSQRTEEDCAGSLCAEEDRAETDGPGNHCGNGPTSLQRCRVEHPFAGEAAHEWNAHHAANANKPRERRMRHLLREAAKLVHVARARRVLHRTGIEKQAALEESVIEAMEKAGGDRQRRADADTQHHVANLAHGGEGQHAFKICLHHGVHDADGHGDGANPDECCSPGSRPNAKTVHARGQINAGRYIASCVQQGTDRGRRGHRLGNPCVERHLHALGHQRDEHEQEDAGGEVVRHIRIGPQGASGAVIEDQDARQQAVARDVRHQQYFARAGDSLTVGVPKANQAE